MKKEELNFIFNIFCESWHFNSYFIYYRNLMFQIEDFKSIRQYLILSPKETIRKYQMLCEKNRLELMKNFFQYKIDWRNLEFIAFEQTEMEQGNSYHFPFEVYTWGNAILSDKKITFRILNLKIFKTLNGFALNVDTCPNEIQIIKNISVNT